MLKLICSLSFALILSSLSSLSPSFPLSLLHSDTYSITAKILNGKDFTLLNDGSASGLQTNKFVNYDTSGLEALPGFPPSSPYAKLQEEQILSDGTILSQLVVGSPTPSGWYPLLYIPDQPMIQLLEEFRKSDIGNEQVRTALPKFTHLQINSTPLIVGLMELRGGPKILFQYDPSIGMEEIPSNPASVPLALNNKGDILLFDATSNQFDLLVDDSLIPLNDLGLKESLMALKREDVTLTEDNLDLNLLDDGSIAGVVTVDDKDMLFVRSPDGSIYLSGLTDKASESSPLWHVNNYASIADEGKGADILFSTTDNLYRLKNGSKNPEKVSLPAELSALAFAKIDGKIWVVAQPKAGDATFSQIVLWKEGEKPINLIDMMEDKSFATYQIDDSDDNDSPVSINKQGDLMLNLSNDDENTSLILTHAVSSEKQKE